MPFFNCSTSLFAYIIYFGGEKNWEEKIFRWCNSTSYIHDICGGVGMLLIMTIYQKISKNIAYLLYIICII